MKKILQLFNQPMKKLFTFFALLLALDNYATILTVNNIAGTVAMYTNAQTAVNAASVGDTVFAHASPTNYGNVTITKRITLMGEGFKGLDNIATSRTEFGTVTIDSISGGSTVSYGQMNGFYCNIISFTVNDNIKGYLIKNIYVFNGIAFGGFGHNVINCHFNTIDLSSMCLVSNCIIRSNIFSGNTCIIANNIFISNTVNIYDVISSSITNNIFLHAGLVVGTGNTSSTFTKNIQGGADLPPGNYYNAVSSDIFSEPNLFPGMTPAAALQLSYLQKPTSPAKNAGTDGKDLGVYGGSYPWPINRIFNGDPGLPQVTQLEVETTVLEPGGTLKFGFKAKSFSKR